MLNSIYFTSCRYGLSGWLGRAKWPRGSRNTFNLYSSYVYLCIVCKNDSFVYTRKNIVYFHCMLIFDLQVVQQMQNWIHSAITCVDFRVTFIITHGQNCIECHLKICTNICYLGFQGSFHFSLGRVKNANFKSGADGYFFSKNKCQLKLHGNMRRQSASFWIFVFCCE